MSIKNLPNAVLKLLPQIVHPVLECRCLLSPAGSHNKGRQPAFWGINWAASQQQKCQRTLPQRDGKDWHTPMSVAASIRGTRQKAKDHPEDNTVWFFVVFFIKIKKMFKSCALHMLHWIHRKVLRKRRKQTNTRTNHIYALSSRKNPRPLVLIRTLFAPQQHSNTATQ